MFSGLLRNKVGNDNVFLEVFENFQISVSGDPQKERFGEREERNVRQKETKRGAEKTGSHTLFVVRRQLDTPATTTNMLAVQLHQTANVKKKNKCAN